MRIGLSLRYLLGIFSFLVLGCLGLFSGALAQASSIHHFAYMARDRAQLKHPGFLNNPHFEGAQVMYLWRRLEPSEGEYDFSDIREDLALLKAHQKKLFIQLQDATFTPQVKPVPRYLETGAEYQGGAAPQYDEQGVQQGWVSRRWDPAVQGKFKQLLCALSQNFDGQIAGINLQETAIEVTHADKPVPSGFSPQAYRDGILTNMEALKSCFQKSLVMQYANFMPGEWLPWENQGYLESVYDFAQKNDIAVGTPDLMPERKGQQNHAYKQMHQRTQQGKPVFGVAVQDGNYFGATGNPKIPDDAPNRVPELYDYASQYLRVQYMFWVIQAPFFTRDLLPFLAQQIEQQTGQQP